MFVRFLSLYTLYPFFSKNFLNIKFIYYLKLRKLYLNKNNNFALSILIMFYYKYILSLTTIDLFSFKTIYFFNSLLLVLKYQLNISLLHYKTTKLTFFCSTINVTSYDWFLKKENLILGFNMLSFYILFDFLKVYIKDYKVLYFFFNNANIFRSKLLPKYLYYKILWMQCSFLMHMFDTFIFYIIRTWTKIKFSQKHVLQRKDKVKTLVCNFLYLSKNTMVYYFRYSNNFLIGLRGKYKGICAIYTEICGFMRTWWKIPLYKIRFSMVSKMEKNVFLGFYFHFNNWFVNKKKLLLHFFLLSYLNKYDNTICGLHQFFLHKNVYTLIKVKYLLHSLIIYYKYTLKKQITLEKGLWLVKNALLNFLL